MSGGKIIVAFDLYGTLLSTASIATELATHFGTEKADSLAALWRRYQLEYTWRSNCMENYQPFSTITRNSLMHALAEHNLTLSSDAVEKLMSAYDSLGTFPDVAPALQALSANAKVSCYVFSNGTAEMVAASVYKSAELAPHAAVFAGIVTVDAVRRFKPDPAVYRFLAKSVGKGGEPGAGADAAMADMWLVSGNPFDVVGARAVGMQAAWVDRAGNGWVDRLEVEEGRGPTVVVRGLEEVADVIVEHAKKKNQG